MHLTHIDFSAFTEELNSIFEKRAFAGTGIGAAMMGSLGAGRRMVGARWASKAAPAAAKAAPKAAPAAAAPKQLISKRTGESLPPGLFGTA